MCCECLMGRRVVHALLSPTVHYYVLFQLENKCMDLYVYIKQNNGVMGNVNRSRGRMGEACGSPGQQVQVFAKAETN
jgi:hypothetical protein